MTCHSLQSLGDFHVCSRYFCLLFQIYCPNKNVLEKQTLERLCKTPFVLPERIANLFETEEKTAIKYASRHVIKLDDAEKNQDRFEKIKDMVETSHDHLHINIFDEVVKFPREGYKIRKIFTKKLTYSKEIMYCIL